MRKRLQQQQFLEELIEVHRRQPLDPDQADRLRECIANDPSLQERWNEEIALSRALRDLPDLPLSSNFNARVWSALEAKPRRSRAGAWWVDWIRWPRPAMRFAAVALAMLLAGLVYTQYQSFSRVRMAASVADITRNVEVAAEVAALPPVEIFRDFDAIYQLSHVGSLADEELLAALQ
jgi:hypothetical protein